jgi:serine/threonine protein kinase/TRAP-type mannitol/chloroaromatic compound transport system substrate-binding protein
LEFRQALPEGSIVGGDYRILAVLGQGGFGLTYRAEDIRLGTPVAIKEYFPSDIAVRESGFTVNSRSSHEAGIFRWGREKFLEEARTLARFRHPNIVRVARLLEANNTAYMVLDFEAGPNLSQWRRALARAPTQDEIDAIAQKLLDAVEAVHAAGILHRDIKPANIIMRDGVTPVLIDFGAARQALSARSRTVHAIVTPGYSPKEQYALDVDRQGPWSDIYALGATFYFLVTGRQPADALSRDLEPDGLMRDVSADGYRPSFLKAIDLAMTVRAEARPQTVAAWRAMLLDGATAAQSGRMGPATAQATERLVRSATFADLPATPVSAPQPRARRSTGWRLAAGLAAALLAAGLGFHQLVLGPAREAEAWQTAQSANTIAAYDAYLAAYPAGRHAAEAQRRRDSIRAAAEAPSVAAPGGRAGVAQVPPAPPVPPEPRNQKAAPAVAPTVFSPVPVPTQPGPPTTTAQPPSDADSSPAPATPGRRVELPVRPSLSGPVPQSELGDLQRQARAAEMALARSAFAGEGHRGFSEQVRDFASELEQLSGGKLKVRIEGADEAPKASQVLAEVAKSGRPLGWHSPIQSSNRRLAYAVFAGAVPFGLDMAGHVRWMRAEGANLLEQAYWRDGFNVRVLPCGIGAGMGGFFRREIRAPGDLRQLKVRSLNTFADQVLRRLGAEVVKLEAANTVAAMADGTVDVFFTLTPAARGHLGASPVAPIFHRSDWFQPAYLFDLVINGDFWLGLGNAERRLLDEACRRTIDKWLTGFPAARTEVEARLRATAGLSVRPFTGPVIEALRTASREVLAELSARDADLAEALASYNRFTRRP